MPSSWDWAMSRRSNPVVPRQGGHAEGVCFGDGESLRQADCELRTECSDHSRGGSPRVGLLITASQILAALSHT